MSISFIFYNNNFNLNIGSGNESGRGAYGLVKISGNKAYKYENLRIITKTIEQKNEIIGKMRPYIKQSYVSANQFLSYIIQKYLYNLNTRNNNRNKISYVPNINEFRFDFESGLSEVKMNISIKDKERFNFSKNFKQLLTEEMYYIKSNYTIFILKIIKKLCDILIFYENKVCFMHKDLNGGNFMINFNIKDNNDFDEDNFEIKLIDFMFSSVVVNNLNSKKSILTYINYRPDRSIDISNPFKNKDWKCIDIKYLFIAIFLRYDLQEKNNNNIKKLFKILDKIFNLSNHNYLNKYKNYSKQNIKNRKNCVSGATYENLVLDKKIHKEIFGKNSEYENYDPEILRQKIKSEIEIFNSN